MKELDNLEPKNFLVTWFFWFLVSYSSFEFEKSAQQFSKQPVESTCWAAYGTVQYILHYSLRTDYSKSFYFTLGLTCQIRIVLLLVKELTKPEFCVYEPVLSNPEKQKAERPVVLVKGGVIACVFRGQGIMENGNLR